MKLTKFGLLTELPIIISEMENEVHLLDNTFSYLSGTKGPVHISFKNTHYLTTFIAGNYFTRCTGFYKSSALHLSSLIESYSL